MFMKHIMTLLIILLLSGCSKDKNATVAAAPSAGMLVFAGDTQERVYQVLGEPSIEFPKDRSLIQWYAGYAVTLSNGMVTAVASRPIQDEAERMEKEERARLADQRLRSAYEAVSQKEKIEYDAWLVRERKREAEKRAELARVEAYKERKAKEKRAAIYAEGMRKSCGCGRHYHCGHSYHWVH
jgi:PAS domain-containing protein